MAGYAASGRITRAHPRFVGSGTRQARMDDSEVTAHAPAVPRVIDTRPLDVRLAERWSELREEWGQATFFLFDPNSWR